MAESSQAKNLHIGLAHVLGQEQVKESQDVQ